MIDEIELVRQFRDEIPGPSGEAWDRARSAISAAQAESVPAGSLERARRRRRRPVVAGALAMALAAAAVVVVVQRQSSGPPPIPGPVPWALGAPIPSGVNNPHHPGLGIARTAVQLVDYTGRAASAKPAYIPSPYDWFYERIESPLPSGKPSQGTGLEWVRVDLREDAAPIVGSPSSIPPGTLWHGNVQFTPMGPDPQTPGWPSLSYRYLSRLPADPAALEHLIAENARPWGPGGENDAVFDAIFDLMSNSLTPVLPPRLYATLYAILAHMPGVRFDRRATDPAGRGGVAFSRVEPGGNIKQEIMINPMTYAYMGIEVVAVRAYTEHGTDGDFPIAAGQVLDRVALLNSAIVRKAGQVP